jgi:hypothetical protein
MVDLSCFTPNPSGSEGFSPDGFDLMARPPSLILVDRKKGVTIAVVAIVLGAAIVVGLWIAAVGPFAPPTDRSSSIFGAPPLALGTFTIVQAGPDYYYNASVQTADGGMSWSNMNFHMQSPSGATLPGASTVTATDSAKTCNVALYSFANASWGAPRPSCSTGTIGGSALVESGAQLDLLSTSNFTDSGDSLVIELQGGFSGSSLFSIP